jgi:phage major head subunit gpT-like protein
MSGTVDQPKLDDAARAFRATFLRELGHAPRDWEQFVRTFPSTGKQTDIKWMGRTAGVHEWVDERIRSKLQAFDFTIVNKTWANGLSIRGEDLEDDNLGVYQDQIADLADDFVQHRMDMLTELLEGGFAGSKGLAYDGQFFFDSDHQDMSDGPLQRNVRTIKLSEQGWYQCKADMAAIRKPNGKHARVRPNLIVIPSALRQVADDLFKKDRRGGGDSNPLVNDTSVLEWPWLTDDDAWYAFDLTKPLKPFAYSDRRAVMFRSKTDPNDDAVFDRYEFEFGADGRYNMGYYFWQLAWASDGTVAPS